MPCSNHVDGWYTSRQVQLFLAGGRHNVARYHVSSRCSDCWPGCRRRHCPWVTGLAHATEQSALSPPPQHRTDDFRGCPLHRCCYGYPEPCSTSSSVAESPLHGRSSRSSWSYLSAFWRNVVSLSCFSAMSLRISTQYFPTGHFDISIVVCHLVIFLLHLKCFYVDKLGWLGTCPHIDYWNVMLFVYRFRCTARYVLFKFRWN